MYTATKQVFIKWTGNVYSNQADNVKSNWTFGTTEKPPGRKKSIFIIIKTEY